MNADEFYVGYQPKAPRNLARFARSTVTIVVTGAAALALAITALQNNFIPSTFEHGKERDFTGALQLRPYPVLVDEAGPHLLFAPGKHGLLSVVPEGAKVRLRGSAVSLGDARGVEVSSMTLIAASVETPAPVRLRSVSLVGEIVDSKCYFGVMNPGRGKVHRDCAVRCISGGIPPALLVRDGSGMLRTLVLSGIAPPALAPWIGERVRVSGELVRYGSLLTLNAAGASSLTRE